SSDGTQAANWIATKGQDRSTPPFPNLLPGQTIDIPDSPQGSAVGFMATSGAQDAKTGYSNWFGAALNVDASMLNAGVSATSHDDIMDLWVQMCNALGI